MISSECFEAEWIQRFKSQNAFRRINPPLLEKMVQALSLLEYLQISGLSFVFKGGTSLILLLKKLRRFSVDIDIIADHTREELEQAFDSIVADSHFTNWELDATRSFQPNIPKAHYAFYYPSSFNKRTNHIFLDILIDSNPYPETIEISVESPWIQIQGEPTLVVTPSVNAIAGDKLTAFAPNSIGIPYQRGRSDMSMEIIKQLFDLDCLLLEVSNLSTVKASFAAIGRKEMVYRNSLPSLTLQSVLTDTVETALLLARRDRNRLEPARSHFSFLQTGIQRFNAFLISGGFNLEQAIEASAKVALLAACIRENRLDAFRQWPGDALPQDLLIEVPEYNFLNRYRKIRSGTFYYWYRALQVMGIVPA